MKPVSNYLAMAMLGVGLTAGFITLADAQSPASKPPVKPWESPVPPSGAPPQSQPPLVPGAPQRTPLPTSPPPQSGPPATAAPVIARVDGRPITQRDYDRLAEPYFARLRGQLGDGFTQDVRKTASHNVLDELIRRELLVVEARRAKLEVTEGEIDQILMQDPFFYTDGKFDAAKLTQFKLSPQSNYQEIMPRLRDVAIADKFDRQLKERLSPTPAAVKDEWSKRNEQVRFQYLPIIARDVSLDPESSEADQIAYHRAHPDQFEKKARIGLRFVRLPLPAEGDSARASEEKQLLARGRGIADSLLRGTPIDSLATAWGGVIETGLFELPATNIPGLGRPEQLLAQLERAHSDTTLRALGPEVTPAAVVVAVVGAREPRRLPPFTEVRSDVKRRADAEKRRTQLEADKLAYFEAHRADFRAPRAQVTRVLLRPAAVAIKDPSRSDIERWYARNGRELFAETAPSEKLPALTDSLRELVRVRLDDETRNTRTAAALARIAAGLRQNPRGIWNLARAEGAKADTITFVKDAPRDSLFPAALVDSMVSAAGGALIGTVQGPRRFGAYDVVWRIEAVDTAFTPSFDAARSRVERAFQEERRLLDETEAKGYFEQHRADYKTKPKFVIEYVQVKTPSPDSIEIAEAELRKFWQQHRADRFRQEEQVRARHILIPTRPDAAPEEVTRARARADSLRLAIVGGADFAELAKKFSSDLGSGARGGELGFFNRTAMVKEFADTSFAIGIGRVSQPVKTRFGFHLIRVDEKKSEGVRPFEEVRGEIRTELAQTRADSLGRNTARRILRQISAVGALAATRQAGGVKTSPPMAATEPLAGVGMVQELAAALPQLTVGKWASNPYKESRSYVLVRPTRRLPAGPAEFDEVKRQAVEDMKAAKKKVLVAQKADQVRTLLAAGATLDSAAITFGGLKDSGLLTRAGGFVPLLGNEPRVIERAFTIKPGTVSDTLHVAQGVVWIRPAEKRALEGSSFAKDRDAILNELLAKKIGEWFESRRQTVRIEVLRADLREPAPPRTRTVTTSIPAGQ